MWQKKKSTTKLKLKIYYVFTVLKSTHTTILRGWKCPIRTNNFYLFQYQHLKGINTVHILIFKYNIKPKEKKNAK